MSALSSPETAASGYDAIGKTYTQTRGTDPFIAAQIHARLGNPSSLLNLGAGSGSYEPADMPVLALEPARTMIRQRAVGSAPVVQAIADALPFRDCSFSTAMSMLSMHHWRDRGAAFAEIRRVVRDRAVMVTWDPAAEPFWLSRDYFPELIEIDRNKFPAMHEFRSGFPRVEIFPLLIPHDCIDGFTGCYWRRPAYYLDDSVRAGMSTFAEIPDPDAALRRLREDLESGAWQHRNAALLAAERIDLGYRVVVAHLRLEKRSG